MLWQLLIVALLVLTAAGYLARSTWRTWTGTRKGGCGGSCGCANKTDVPQAASDRATMIPVEDVILRRRSSD